MTELTTKLFAVEMISGENRTLLSTNYTREGAESVIKKLTDKIRIARPESAFEVVEFKRVSFPAETGSMPEDVIFSGLTDDEFTARLGAFLGEGAAVPLFRKDGRIERAKTLALPCFANLLKEQVQ